MLVFFVYNNEGDCLNSVLLGDGYGKVDFSKLTSRDLWHSLEIELFLSNRGRGIRTSTVSPRTHLDSYCKPDHLFGYWK